MSFALLSEYLSEVSDDPATVWNWAELVKLAGKAPPDAVLPRHAPMLRADTYAIWVRWFVEGLCNPLRYVEDEKKTVIDVYADTLARVDALYPQEPKDEREAFAGTVARRVMREVERRRRLGRTGASSALKQELIDRAPHDPRCWICGYKFEQDAVDRFLKRRSGIALRCPEFVDILRPRGLIPRDLGIEVEHMVPVADGGGGDDNLALACGWCNRSKGARTSIYDIDGRAPRSVYMLGHHVWLELPHPFWTVRILATRRRCEHVGGCDARSDNSELFIAPGDPSGAPNPSNLFVYCRAHDPYSVDRLLPREQANKIWSDRIRSR